MSRIARKVKSQPAVVFFDAAGTLIHLTRSAGWHYAQVATRHGLEISEAVMDQAFRTAWASPPPRKAGRRTDDDKGWWRLLAEQTLENATTIPVDFPRTAWFEELYEHFAQPDVWTLYEDVRPSLEKLHGSFRLAVLSNFDGRLRRIFHHLEIEDFFEKIFISSEMGCEKPDREIFLRAAKEMMMPPSRCLHVGDDPTRDWEGATNAGFSVFSLDRPQNSLRELSVLLGANAAESA